MRASGSIHVRRTLVIVLIVLCCAVCIIACMMINPMRRSEESIRDALLEKTPIGTSVDEVLQVIQAELKHENDTEPSYAQTPALERGPQGYTVPVGKKSIRLRLGSHWYSVPGYPIVTIVYASWAFDENDRLIEILVHKENDAP